MVCEGTPLVARSRLMRMAVEWGTRKVCTDMHQVLEVLSAELLAGPARGLRQGAFVFGVGFALETEV